jgi:hypothetical protein
MGIDDKIANALDMEILPDLGIENGFPTVQEENSVPAIPTEIDHLLEGDFDLVRNNILKAIEDGKTTLDEIMIFARQVQSDKAYAALAAFFDKYVSANKALLEIHKEKKNLTPAIKTGNVNVLILTTSELLHKLKQEQNDKG